MNINLIFNLNLIVLIITLLTALMVVISLVYIHFFAKKETMTITLSQCGHFTVIRNGKTILEIENIRSRTDKDIEIIKRFNKTWGPPDLIQL